MGFLLSRRWIVFALVVAVLAYATWWLGGWQFRRLDDRKAENAVVRTNEHRAVAPVADVLSPDRDPSEQDEWRVVSATGTYDEARTVVIRYRNRGGVQGVDVVVPLITATAPRSSSTAAGSRPTRAARTATTSPTRPPARST